MSIDVTNIKRFTIPVATPKFPLLLFSLLRSPAKAEYSVKRLKVDSITRNPDTIAPAPDK